MKPSANAFAAPGPKGSAFAGKGNGNIAAFSRDPTQAAFDRLVEATLASGKHGPQPSDMPKIAFEEEKHVPVVRLVDALLKEALSRRASDIHLEPSEQGLRIRLRTDGELHELLTLPKVLSSVVAARLKILAELDICEKRVPQDGCIRLRSPKGADADFRMSTMPCVFGENVVLRVLCRDNLNNTLDQVGMPQRELRLLRHALSKPDGAVLVTGPTGSGKTTTLYAALTELNKPERCIFTAEDPVEGTLRGIVQIQVNSSVGLTFAPILRSLLRQDPDVIMIGEIRDKETIEIATRAALTGHLVLSTLHTNDTASTVERMLDMGVEPYLITAAVDLIIAQRLVRRICPDCKTEVQIAPDVLHRLGCHAAAVESATVYQGRGCAKCADTGYRGRIALFEAMPLSSEIKEHILRGTTRARIKILARLQGMTTLREAGVDLALEGETSLDEVVAKTNEDSHDEYVDAQRKKMGKPRKRVRRLGS